ncbi:MAG: GH25 family lysozyme [Leptospirales bacterium]
MKYFLTAGVLAVFILFGGYYLFNNGLLWFVYPDKEIYPIMGVDVSHHQGKIDWEELARQGVRFAFIKSTEGGDFKDSRFKENIRNAKKANIPVGAYHFFTFCRPGLEQAKNFIETVPKDTIDLAPVIDLEFGGNCSATPSQSELNKQLSLYVDAIVRHYNRNPIFYITTEFLEAYPLKKFQNIDLWMRNIYRPPESHNKRGCTFWQYHSRGRLKGVSEFIDLNVYCGDQVSFEKFLDQ